MPSERSLNATCGEREAMRGRFRRVDSLGDLLVLLSDVGGNLVSLVTEVCEFSEITESILLEGREF